MRWRQRIRCWAERNRCEASFKEIRCGQEGIISVLRNQTFACCLVISDDYWKPSLFLKIFCGRFSVKLSKRRQVLFQQYSWKTCSSSRVGLKLKRSATCITKKEFGKNTSLQWHYIMSAQINLLFSKTFTNNHLRIPAVLWMKKLEN